MLGSRAWGQQEGQERNAGAGCAGSTGDAEGMAW